MPAKAPHVPLVEATSRLSLNCRAQDMVEYALLAGFIAVAAGALLPGISSSISTIFSKIGSLQIAASGGRHTPSMHVVPRGVSFLTSADVLQVLVSASSGIWVATGAGVFNFDQEGDLISEIDAPSDHWYVADLAEDSDGSIWAASQQGLYYLPPGVKEFRPVVVDVGASSLAVAYDGTIWVATRGQGILEVLDYTVERRHTAGVGLLDDYVSSIAIGGDGKIWAGARSGLSTFDGSAWKSVPELEGRWIYALETSPDKILIGANDGLAVFENDPPTWTVGNGTAEMMITAIRQSDIGIGVGTRDGQFLFYGQGNTRVAPIVLTVEELGFSGSPITAISEIGEEGFVIGSFGGGVSLFQYLGD